MTSGLPQDERRRLSRLCEYYELQWRRASAGAVSANKAIRRLKLKVERLQEDLRLAEAEMDKLRHVNHEQEKKLERLSLKIIDMWGIG
jgi:hypothetical protein